MTEKVDEEITITQVMEILGLSRTHVIKLVRDGVLEGRLITPGLWLVKRGSLGNFKPQRKKHRGE